jgi:DtxR family Mn-dependent transcriptional regulator
MNITNTLEDYLEAVYILQKNENHPVRVKEIASFLDVNKTTVVASIKKLKENELVNQEHYGYVFLTEEGEKEAQKIYKKHSVLKNFLTEVLGIEEKKADDEACKMEHILSEETIRKIKNLSETYQKENS